MIEFAMLTTQAVCHLCAVGNDASEWYVFCIVFTLMARVNK
ncbi:hypothetical protein GMES_0191 [Paraglaciecola mesophila KMM 241]|uniref:Uncharacterized protein n=1 Tax=Paraglaciecola mesophila KMM 241 TaxID=1128912 RepID=K6YEV6_9ALTE|nr:hypothetical protein GMES_0191 [Paraglaciecola mesophila KMM 241]